MTPSGFRAEHAAERHAYVLGAPRLGDDPRPLLPGRIVPNMLGMAAFEIRDPVSQVVLVKSDDAARYGGIGGHVKKIGPS